MNYLQSYLTDRPNQNVAVSNLHSVFESIERFQLQTYAKKRDRWKKQARNYALTLFAEGNILKLQELDEVLNDPKKSKFNKERYLELAIIAKNNDQLDPNYPKLRSDLMVENTKVLDCAVTVLEKADPEKPMYKNIVSCGRAIHVRLNRMTGLGFNCSNADESFDYERTDLRKVLTDGFVRQVRQDRSQPDLKDRAIMSRAIMRAEKMRRAATEDLDTPTINYH